MPQDEQQRVQRIKEYVLSRLRGELSAAPRGAQARLAKQLGVSGAHLSNMLSPTPTRQPGEDFRRKVAAHWGMTYAQLEALAIGEELPPSSSGATTTMPEAYVTAVNAYAWTPELPGELRRVVTEQARQHWLLLGREMDHAEWQRVLAGLERAALEWLARVQAAEPASAERAHGHAGHDHHDSPAEHGARLAARRKR